LALKYTVTLSAEERLTLEDTLAKAKASARKMMRARILLMVDAGPFGLPSSDEEVVEGLGTSPSTVLRARERFVTEGFEAALEDKKSRRVQPRRLDGTAEAHLVALACSPAPEGHAKWTLRLFADRLVELDVVDSVSRETVRRTLKKTNSSRGRTSNG